MNSAQQKYPTGEQELLSIVETLKEFKNILLGQNIIVHTDHKNLLYEKSSSDRVIRWRLLIEEFAPTFLHIAGEKNVVADALSRLDANFEKVLSNQPIKNEEIAATFISVKDTEEYEYPLSGKVIQKCQQADKSLRTKRRAQRGLYGYKTLENVKVITYKNKIYIPEALQLRVIEWYHEYLCHPGETRTEETIRRTMTWPNLREQVRSFCKTCKQCQKCKKIRKQYGHLPAKKYINLLPWQRVDVDCIGPYTVRIPGKKYELRAMTMIDPATRWFEVVQIISPTAKECMEAFNNTWLCRYPRPTYVGYDNGSEWKQVFKEMCKNYGISPKTSTEYNPQSNSTIERVHLTLGNMLRAFELEEQELNENDPWSSFLGATSFAIRSTFILY